MDLYTVAFDKPEFFIILSIVDGSTTFDIIISLDSWRSFSTSTIFETSLKNQGVKLSLGDPFGKEYFQLIIEPRVIYSDSEYYITTLYRNSLEKTQDFTTNLTNNITTILDKLASS